MCWRGMTAPAQPPHDCGQTLKRGAELAKQGTRRSGGDHWPSPAARRGHGVGAQTRGAELAQLGTRRSGRGSSPQAEPRRPTGAQRRRTPTRTHKDKLGGCIILRVDG